MIYLYDGSFEGALSAVYDMFYSKDKEVTHQLVIKSQYQYQFFDDVCETEVNTAHVEKVVASIIHTFGEEAFRRIGYAYLSEDDSFGTKLYRGLKKAYKMGSNAFENLSDPDIIALYKCYNAVARESHRMVGFIRFKELDQGVFYAQFEPTYDLLGLMIPHFTERLGDQLWVIHDTKRRKAAFYNKESVHISDLDPIETLRVSNNELSYQEMWKMYFDNIAIEARKNPRQHRQMMPKKYWNFLTEKNK